MTRYAGIATGLFLAACTLHPVRPSFEGEPGDRVDLREEVLKPESAEPVWRDLTRHTDLQHPYEAIQPAPSRDGRFLAYVTNEFGPRRQIALKDTEGAAPLQMTPGRGESLFPRISPDGRLLAYCSDREGNWDIFVARTDAPLAVTQVTFDPSDDIAPSWSPDGKRLAYCSREGEGPWRIVLVDVGTRIKTYLGPGLYPDWSPDPQDPWICFQSLPRTPGGRSSIWIVRPDGTGLRRLVSDRSGRWSAVHPRFSPNGRWIVYATLRRSPESLLLGAPEPGDDVWIIRLDGTRDMRLTEDLTPEGWPSWGGNRIFFVSCREGGRNIYSVQPKPLEEEP